jgi:hypothetical protein
LLKVSGQTKPCRYLVHGPSCRGNMAGVVNWPYQNRRGQGGWRRCVMSPLSVMYVYHVVMT